MKKSKKILLRILPVFIVFMVFFTTNIFAINVAEPTSGNASSTVSSLSGRVWGTISVVVQMVAIGAIVFAGVRYMFASADDKANIKKQTVILVVGAVLVFAAVPLTKLIVNAAKEIIG